MEENKLTLNTINSIF